MQAFEGILVYNNRNERYGLYDPSEGWIIDGFHCGDCFEVFEGGKWTPTRMESFDNQWYLAGTEYIGRQLESMKARILRDW